MINELPKTPTQIKDALELSRSKAFFTYHMSEDRKTSMETLRAVAEWVLRAVTLLPPVPREGGYYTMLETGEIVKVDAVLAPGVKGSPTETVVYHRRNGPLEADTVSGFAQLFETLPGEN